MVTAHDLKDHNDGDRKEPEPWFADVWARWKARGIVSDDSYAGRALSYEAFIALLSRLEAKGWLFKPHTHGEYAPKTHGHSGFAPASHGHSGFASTSHSHPVGEHDHDGVYSAAGHQHAPDEHHTHEELAKADHDHPVKDHTHGGVE